jgi:hypothetical protein
VRIVGASGPAIGGALVASRHRFFGRISDVTLGIGLLALGALYLAHALYVRRHPDWRITGWWSRHPSLSFVMGGLSSNEARGPTNEFVWAGALLAVGALILATM